MQSSQHFTEHLLLPSLLLSLCVMQDNFDSKQGTNIFPTIQLQSLLYQPLKKRGQMESVQDSHLS